MVSAVGDVPNIEWLAGGGLTEAGVLRCDGRGLVRPQIAAVGDLAAVPTPHGVRRIPLWISAIEQAKVGAAALLWGDEASRLELQPYFWTEQFGLNLKMVGYPPLEGPPDYLEGVPGGSALMRWPCRDGTGVAAALNFRISIPRLRRVASCSA